MWFWGNADAETWIYESDVETSKRAKMSRNLKKKFDEGTNMTAVVRVRVGGRV